MASLLETVICEHCGCKDASLDYYYRSDESYFYCPQCGKYDNHYIEKKDGKAVYITEDIDRAKVVVSDLEGEISDWRSPELNIDLSVFPTRYFGIRRDDGSIKHFPSFAKMDKEGSKVSYPHYIDNKGGGNGVLKIWGRNGFTSLSLSETDDAVKMAKDISEKEETVSKIGYSHIAGDKWVTETLFEDSDRAERNREAREEHLKFGRPPF